MLHTIQHIILWGKFRSLNKRYQTHIERVTSEGNEASKRQVEEIFWHETALLLEERRRLHFPKTIMHPNLPNLPLSTNYPKEVITRHGGHPQEQNLSQHQPPSAAYIVLFSLLSSVAMGTGFFWLVVPPLLY